jgi:hypothetical protein
MKVNALKELLKQAVREVFQEELKEIVLESVRGSRNVIQESVQHPKTPKIDKKAMYEAMVGGFNKGSNEISFTTENLQGLAPQPGFNPTGVMPGADLPAGNVSLDQIIGLLNK